MWPTNCDVVDDTAYRQRTVVDANHRGGWTQILGVKASEPETYRPVIKRNFICPTDIWRPRGDPSVGADPIVMSSISYVSKVNVDLYSESS